MMAWLRKLVVRFSKSLPFALVLGGAVLGRTSASERPSSIPERIAAVQKAVQKMPPDVRQPFLLRAQWGNWANWNNWNNWANWANFRNWNNWGNWANF
jgi:hypothetical protein